MISNSFFWGGWSDVFQTVWSTPLYTELRVPPQRVGRMTWRRLRLPRTSSRGFGWDLWRGEAENDGNIFIHGLHIMVFMWFNCFLLFFVYYVFSPVFLGRLFLLVSIWRVTRRLDCCRLNESNRTQSASHRVAGCIHQLRTLASHGNKRRTTAQKKRTRNKFAKEHYLKPRSNPTDQSPPTLGSKELQNTSLPRNKKTKQEQWLTLNTT